MTYCGIIHIRVVGVGGGGAIFGGFPNFGGLGGRNLTPRVTGLLH